MKTLNFTMVLVVLLCVGTFAVAQEEKNDYSYYLEAAVHFLDEGNCEKSEGNYRVYKNMTGKTSASIERLISECKGQYGSGVRKYKINDKIKVDSYLYRVAYLEDDGTHGFAIYDYGADPISEDMIKNRKLPTRSEMAIISSIADTLKLDKNLEYWTMDSYYTSSGGYKYYYYRLSNKFTSYDYKSSSHAILLIYRF